MRTRNEIEKDWDSLYDKAENAQILSLEVLLDIRDLLANPVVIETGTDTTKEQTRPFFNGTITQPVE